MSSVHDELNANAAAYVLGSLDADERRAFESHVAECGECAAEVASLRSVTGALAAAVPQVTPRAELRDRVLAQTAGQSGANPSGSPGEPALRQAQGAPSSSRGGRLASHKGGVHSGVSWLPLAAAVLVAVGVGVYAVRLQQQVADLQARLDQALLQASAANLQVADARRVADQAQSAMSVLAAPDLARIDLAGQMVAPSARARALWSRARGMVFTAANLPPLPAGKVYQVWVVTAQAPVSAGLLQPDPSGGGTEYYMTPPDIGAPVAVAVTLEPAGGVPAPTGDKYLVGTPGL